MAMIRAKDIRFTPFTEQKMRVWFALIDVNKDGHMSRDDYVIIADRFIKEYCLSGERARVIRDWLVDYHKMSLTAAVDGQQETLAEVEAKIPKFVAIADNLRLGAKITVDEFIAGYRQFIEAYPRLAKRAMEKMFATFFELFDENSDNYISEPELTSAMRCLGYKDLEMVKKVFNLLDVNQDGKLSLDEYVGGWINFLFGQDRKDPFVQAFAPQLAE